MSPDIASVELSTGPTLEYVERGPSSGTPVVFLHGLSDSWRSFERVLPHLPETVRAFAVSQRGHGDSGRPEEGYASRDFAGDAVAFLDALELDAALVVGHSSGAVAAQRMAIDHPTRTRGLVLASSFHDMTGSPPVEGLWEELSAMDDPVDPTFVREFQKSTLVQSVPDDFFETVVEESLKLPARVWKAVVQSNLEEDFTGQRERIEAPTLLVWGDRDEIVPREDQEALLEEIRGSRLVVYEGVGHALHWEVPERFANDVGTFVDEIV